MKINIDLNKLDKLNKAINIAFDATIDKLDVALDDAITGEYWEWQNETLRKNGDLIPPGLRDIVDTGNLLDSKTIARSSEGNQVEWSWDTDYALYVHEGVTLQSGTELPARPWTEKALETVDVKSTFETQLKREIDRL